MCMDRIENFVHGPATTVKHRDLESDAQFAMLLAGTVKALSEIAGIGTTTARACKRMYTSLIITFTYMSGLAPSSSRKGRVVGSEFVRVISKRVKKEKKTGAEIVVSNICNDVSSTTPLITDR